MEDNVIQALLDAVFATIIAFLVIYIKSIRETLHRHKEENEAIRVAMLAFLHDRLFYICKAYIKRGYLPLDDAEDIFHNAMMVYQAYKVLGGNGEGSRFYDRLIELPIKDDSGKENSDSSL